MVNVIVTFILIILTFEKVQFKVARSCVSQRLTYND